MGLFKKLFGDYSTKEVKRVSPLADKVLSYDEAYQKLTDEQLKAKTNEFKQRLQNGETTDDILPEAFAVCREAAWRVLNMKHFRVQIIGGIILHQGRIAEMKTGEGKTLVATLPAYLNALEGKGVHIVTVNDYLARRDSEWMGKLYRFRGLEVGLIVNGLDTDERRAAYAADITYGTNNEMGFDYLRDNMSQYMKDKVQRGHFFAVVDEVDSILIDEARTPLIISGMGGESSQLYNLADSFVRTLRPYKITEVNTKENIEEISAEADYIIDEKARTATLTENGVKKAERAFNVENLTDPENLSLSHHINIAIKAHGVMKNGVDYIVKEGKVYIVDEFTGRIMIGRRYNEGLHQAIESKEGVKIERESKTLATITFQNYFRLYKKLSGMTGTAMTESTEFQEIYSLDVVEIPTNKPLARKDNNDALYLNEQYKFNAIIKQVVECHKKGQPVLVGTVSIEKSEKLSAALKKAGVKHNVLNAKHHDREAEIVAQAGKLGAVTIATNMAGRGTDIKLGGNSEYLAKAEMRRMDFSEELIAEATGFAETDNEEILNARKTFKELEAKYDAEISSEADAVRQAGGLFIIGTERHESRRIDNQLRGRSGRQGDPGESRFFLSTQDDLLRLFGGERVEALTRRMPVADEPFDIKVFSTIIENAQKKMEGNNFAVRRHVLSFDDVMNRQREVIYAQRDKVLDGEDVHPVIEKMIHDSIVDNVDFFCPDAVSRDEWHIQGIVDKYKGWLIDPATDFSGMKKKQIVEFLLDRADEVYKQREEILGEEMREFERIVLLKAVDTNWMAHIDAMEELKRGVNLRAYGQQDPVVVFRMESFDMFEEMNRLIREQTAQYTLAIPLRPQAEMKREQVAKITGTGGGSGDGSDKKRPVKKAANEKVSPNSPCPCGSGKKYKKCCGDPKNAAKG